MFIQQISPHNAVLPCGTALLKIQIAIARAWLATSSKPQSTSPITDGGQLKIHTKHWYTTALLLSPGCGSFVATKTNAKKIFQNKSKAFGDLQCMQCCRAPQGLFWDPLQGCSCFPNMEGSTETGWQADTTPL